MVNLQAEGFSPTIIDTFFRPFLGGIFFDNSLGTSSRLFQFVMRMLATGSNCLPKVCEEAKKAPNAKLPATSLCISKLGHSLVKEICCLTALDLLPLCGGPHLLCAGFFSISIGMVANLRVLSTRTCKILCLDHTCMSE